ncbi:MAG: 2-C-methyl-D-erythritol 4-phosphate cytidylyltransferase [Eubacterium sp.]|nr:2-C-methyl-D-erythritol 4-phosphate cytidylyltransferase [Eubacterium sp.]
MVIACIFAGGVGRRMKSTDMPKQFLMVGQKPIIIRTMWHFEKHPEVDHIVVACKEEWIDHLNGLIQEYGLKKVTAVIPGGETGYASIHNGIMKAAEIMENKKDIVLICDGVRPILSEKLISDSINYARKYETAVPVTPSIDSLLYSEDGEECQKSYERSSMYVTQAPQGYTMEKILWAHEEAEKRGIINAVSSSELLIELGEKVHLFKGERSNIKVTTPEDLEHLRATFFYRAMRTYANEEIQ